MKVNVTTAIVVGAVIVLVIGGLAVGAVAGFTMGQAQATATHSHRGCDERLLQEMPAALHLDFMQQEKLRRVSDRAHGQFVDIRQDVRQKKSAVMDAAISEILPLLTPEQQGKLADLEKAREEMRRAKEKFDGALNISPTPPF